MATDPAATKKILEIPVTKIMTVHRAPYRVPVFSDDTGELVPKPGQEDKPAVEQEIEMQAADTASLFDDLLRKYPRVWAQFQGDGGQFALLDQALAEISNGFIKLRRSTYEWLHGKSESGKGENDGKPGALHRKEPASIVKKRLGLADGEKLPDDWQDHQQTVAMQIWGLNEDKFCRYLMTVDEAIDITETDGEQ